MVSYRFAPATIALVDAIAESYRDLTPTPATKTDVIRLALVKLAYERLPYEQVEGIIGKL